MIPASLFVRCGRCNGTGTLEPLAQYVKPLGGTRGRLWDECYRDVGCYKHEECPTCEGAGKVYR